MTIVEIVENQTLTLLRDPDNGSTYENYHFNNCTFDNCSISTSRDVMRRATVKNVLLTSCASFNSIIGPTVFEEVTIRNFRVNDLLIMWAPLFKHVTISGKIVGGLKLNINAHFDDRSAELQRPFDEARIAFYNQVDWALDISEAVLSAAELHGVPAKLVRRDPETQAIVLRQKVVEDSWRARISEWNPWPISIDFFLSYKQPDMVLVARKGNRKKFRKDLDGLKELRDLGVVEPD